MPSRGGRRGSACLPREGLAQPGTLACAGYSRHPTRHWFRLCIRGEPQHADPTSSGSSGVGEFRGQYTTREFRGSSRGSSGDSIRNSQRPRILYTVPRIPPDPVSSHRIEGYRGESACAVPFVLLLANVMPFTGRGRADDHSNHSKRSAAAVQCNGGLCHALLPPLIAAWRPTALQCARDSPTRLVRWKPIEADRRVWRWVLLLGPEQAYARPGPALRRLL